MEYVYQRRLNDLKDLQHIHWLVDHIDEYEFHGNADQIKDTLIKKIKRKNSYYSDCVRVYEEFCNMFDNNPQNYRTQLLPNSEDYISSKYPDHYLTVVFADGKPYTVSIAYAMESDKKDSSALKSVLENGKIQCWETISRVRDFYAEAVSTGQSYAGNMKERRWFAQRECRLEQLMLVFNWFIFLVYLLSNIFTDSIRDLVVKKTDFSGITEFLKELAFENKVECAEFLAEIVLLFVLISVTVREFRKYFISIRMKQISEHESEREDAYIPVRTAFDTLLTDPEGELTQDDFYTPAAELIRLSAMRYSFRYPKGIEPQAYAAYGSELNRVLKKIFIILVIIIIARFMTAHGLLGLNRL